MKKTNKMKNQIKEKYFLIERDLIALMGLFLLILLLVSLLFYLGYLAGDQNTNCSVSNNQSFENGIKEGKQEIIRNIVDIYYLSCKDNDFEGKTIFTDNLNRTAKFKPINESCPSSVLGVFKTK